MDILRRPLSVRAELDRLLSRVQPKAQTRAITVTCKCPLALTVNADPAKFQHALRHVLENALKFSPEGSEVTVVAEGSSGGGVTISVRDQGPGIDPALHERIFEQFYQTNIDNGRTSHHDGLGVGLTIARAISRAHGGDVTVVSAPGQGSTFWMHLPGTPADWDR